MINPNYTYRLLEEDDFFDFVDLHKSKEKFMGRVLSTEEKLEYISRLEFLFHQPNYKVGGCFLNDSLVAVSAGGYHEPSGIWYTHGQAFNLGIDSFASVRSHFAVHAGIMKLLTAYGEQHNIFQFYTARELDEGKADFEFRNRLMARDPSVIGNLRYEILWDGVYQPGDECKREQHRFFFKPYNVLKVPTLITLHILKNEYRMQYFNQNTSIGM